MQKATEDILSCLEDSDWFSSVGQPLERADVVLVSTWKEAIKAVGSRKQSDAALEAANLLREAIVAASKERFRIWNKLVIGIREVPYHIAAAASLVTGEYPRR